jgi:hypothetical protein
MHLHPIATQYGVGSHSYRVGTLVDVVCRSTIPGKEKEMIPIEVKTGSMCGAKHTGRSLSVPFTAFPDSLFNQFQLQLAGNVVLLNITLQDHINKGTIDPITTGYIMRANAGMVQVTSLDPRIIEQQNAIRNAFSKSKH